MWVIYCWNPFLHISLYMGFLLFATGKYLQNSELVWTSYVNTRCFWSPLICIQDVFKLNIQFLVINYVSCFVTSSAYTLKYSVIIFRRNNTKNYDRSYFNGHQFVSNWIIWKLIEDVSAVIGTFCLMQVLTCLNLRVLQYTWKCYDCNNNFKL